MKGEVRDDIISLDNYVAAEFKYKEYLELLFNAGGYCFLDQFKTFIQSGATIIKNMQEHSLVGVENINNCYKYVYLTDTATKYLELRGCKEDYSNVKKNQISVKKFKKNPSQKQLFISAFKFHLLTHGDRSVTKESINKTFYEYLLRINFHNNMNDVSKEILDELIKKYEDKNNELEDEIKAKELKIKENESNFLYILGGLKNSPIDREIRELSSESRIVSEQIDNISKTTLKRGLADTQNQKKCIDLKIELLKQQQEMLDEIINKSNKVINSLKYDLNKLVENKNKINNIENIIKTKLKEQVNPVYEELRKKVDNLHDISKVIARLDEDKLEFNIFDCGHFSTGYSYIKHINSLEVKDSTYKAITIVIYSYAENRANNLLSELERLQKEREGAKKTVDSYLAFIDSKGWDFNYHAAPDHYKAAIKILDEIPVFNVVVKSNMYYMGKYIKNISKADKVIKLKDRKAIDELANILNSK